MLITVTAFLIAEIATTALAAPHIQGYREDPFVPEAPVPCGNETATVTTEVYDQRQNGSENYRINVNGVVVLLAPADTILAAANLQNVENELSSLKPDKVPSERPPSPVLSTATNVPETSSGNYHPSEECAGGKCDGVSNSTVKQRGKLKMMNNILQLFRNLKEESIHA